MQKRPVFCLFAILLSVGLVISPALASDGNQTPSLVVLTYNVLYKNTDLPAIAEVIRASNADVVLLQEVTDDLAHDLPPLLDDVYPFTAMHVAARRRLGLGVFSRYPLLLQNFRPDFSLDSSSLSFQIDLDGISITIYNVHLANQLIGSFRYDATRHNQSVSWLLDSLPVDQSGPSTPLLVGGDFNFANFSADYTRMTEHLTDSFIEANHTLNFGFTFPADALIPLLRLDYVFHNAAFTAQSALVSNVSGGSDHFPLRVELSLAEQGS